MRMLEDQVNQIGDTVRRQEQQRTRGDNAIRSFVGCWFKMITEDVETYFPTSSQLPQA